MFFTTGRNVKYFGDKCYRYSNTVHSALDYRGISQVDEIVNFVNLTFPEIGFNSILFNYYPNSTCIIPDHSDNETEIDNDSFILTLTLGFARSFIFKQAVDRKIIFSTTPLNGEFIVFSKNSQKKFSHGIPAASKFSHYPRISATFRNIS